MLRHHSDHVVPCPGQEPDEAYRDLRGGHSGGVQLGPGHSVQEPHRGPPARPGAVQYSTAQYSTVQYSADLWRQQELQFYVEAIFLYGVDGS